MAIDTPIEHVGDTARAAARCSPVAPTIEVPVAIRPLVATAEVGEVAVGVLGDRGVEDGPCDQRTPHEDDVLVRGGYCVAVTHGMPAIAASRSWTVPSSLTTWPSTTDRRIAATFDFRHRR